MASPIGEVFATFRTMSQGFFVTFKNMFRKTVTENYPHEPVHFQPRYRGIHVLHRDENGLEKCGGAQKAPDAFLQPVLVAMQHMNSAVAGLKMHRLVPVIFLYRPSEKVTESYTQHL